MHQRELSPFDFEAPPNNDCQQQQTRADERREKRGPFQTPSLNNVARSTCLRGAMASTSEGLPTAINGHHERFYESQAMQRWDNAE